MTKERATHLTVYLGIPLLLILAGVFVGKNFFSDEAKANKQSHASLLAENQQTTPVETKPKQVPTIPKAEIVKTPAPAPKPSPQPAPQPTVKPTPPINQATEAIRNLIVLHNDASNLNGDAGLETSYFASKVNFFGSTKSRSAVLKDFTNYANKWSVQRNFIITGGRSAIKVKEVGKNNYRITVPKSYTLEHTAGNLRTGNLKNTFTVRFNNQIGRFEITGISE